MCCDLNAVATETRGGCAPPALANLLLREEDREEDDSFGQSRTEDRLDQDWRGRTWVASHCFRCLESDHSHCKSGTDSSKTDV